MNNLVNYKNSSPYKFCFLMVLYAIGASSLPIIPEQFFNISSLSIRLIIFFVLKVLTIIFPIYIIKSIGFINQFKFDIKNSLKATIILFPFIVVCVNNIPLVAVFTGGASFEKVGITYLYYILVCLSIAVFEELIFRGIIYPIIKEKKQDFWAIIYSSLIFSVAHLVNALSINIGAMLMQLGYSFLIGAMCAVAYNYSSSIYFAIILHFVYNFGGLMTNYNLVSGNIWNLPSIVVTAILAVITVIYTIIVYFSRIKNESSSSKG